MKKIAIIIPCYNEEDRLKQTSIYQLIESKENVEVFLVNDGSADHTLKIINEFASLNDKIKVINFSKNEGKAKTIYKSFLQLKDDKKFTHFGYLDADFSTESIEYLEMYKELLNSDKEFIFGSRIATLNTQIERKPHRHYIGRVIITFINFFFHLKIYDTQCGAKIFSKKILTVFTKNNFYTNWLFDIEIFIRLSNANLLYTGIEHPLKRWKDVGGSKIKKIDSFYILWDILKLIRNYK